MFYERIFWIVKSFDNFMLCCHSLTHIITEMPEWTQQTPSGDSKVPKKPTEGAVVVTHSLGKESKSSDLHPGTSKADVGLQRGKSTTVF